MSRKEIIASKEKLLATKEKLIKFNRYRNAVAIVVCLISATLFVVTFLLHNFRAPPIFLTNFAPFGTMYEQIYNRSVMLSFKAKPEYGNPSFKMGGTGWIIDYDLDPFSTLFYPKVFYIATNVHVAGWYNNLKFCDVFVTTGELENKGDVVREKQIQTKSAETIYMALNFVKLAHFNKINATIDHGYHHQTRAFNYTWPLNYEEQNVPVPGSIDAVHDLWTNQQRVYSPMIDFAVLRIEFASVNDAIFATHNFVKRQTPTNFFRFDWASLNTLKNRRWYVGGYPYYTWSINASPNNRKEEKYPGHWLSKWQENYSALFDFQFMGGTANIWRQYGNFYIAYGIQLMLDMSSLGPGSSGSVVCDENGTLGGIHWGGEKCGGNDCTHVLINDIEYDGTYNGIYGKFIQKIIPYNLIYQNIYSTSYEESLKAKFPNIHTYLFH